MKTLKAKIVAVIALLLAVSVIITGGVSVLLGYKATTDTLEQSMSQMAKVASERMKWELGAYKSMASDMGLIKQLSDNDNITTLKTKLDMLAARVADNGFLSGHLVTIAGVSLTDGTNFAGQDFFEAALKGQTFLSDPVINADNTVELKIGAPVWQMAKRGLKVVGVLVVSVDGDILSQIVEGIKVSENGSAYMIDRSGNVIAHRKRELVTVKSNTIADAKTDPSQADLAELEQKMLNGESGFGQYYYGGENKVLSYAPIPETNGWSLAITAPQADFMQQTMRSVYITVALVAVMVLVGIVAATFIARGISQPVKACAERLERVAEGDLTSPVPVVNSKDEMQVLAQATATILFEVQGIISDMDDTLARMANGDLSLDEGRAALYKGDFRNLFLSLQKISGDLSDTMRHIMRAAEQVSLGSGHVSAGAQSLSQGTTEQAGTVQQLFASVSSISEQVKENADNAAQSKHLAAEAEAEVLEGNERMREMTRAMGEIRASSDEIGKIIKAIEDIAFQTNMLALNAAVEAARAGEAGKGFAVVADEVRNLASKSAEAASTTTALIKGSLQAVENGERIAGRTAESLEAVVRRVKELAGTVEQITQASQQQARAVAQVTQGMEQISAVVQNNSATAEESAAASEQLSSQASLLQDMMKRFQLGEA